MFGDLNCLHVENEKLFAEFDETDRSSNLARYPEIPYRQICKEGVEVFSKRGEQIGGKLRKNVGVLT